MAKKVKLATALGKSRDRHLENVSKRGMERSGKAKLPAVFSGGSVSHGVDGHAPASRHALGKAIYGSWYYVSYGAVYASLIVLGCIPQGSAIGKGIHDGNQAARSAFAARSHAECAGGRGGDTNAVMPGDQPAPA